MSSRVRWKEGYRGEGEVMMEAKEEGGKVKERGEKVKEEGEELS